MPKIIEIAAISEKTRAIGLNNKLLWNIPQDLAKFRDITKGHPIIMGRKTWESLPKRPLPNRTNIVVSRTKLNDVSSAENTTDAINIATKSEGAERIFIIGGAQIYELFLPFCDELLLTIVHSDEKEADTFFPKFESDFKLVSSEDHEEGDTQFTFTKWDRKN